MNHSDHVELLRGGIPERGGVWADFGAGSGAFTLALADLIGPEGTIHAVDRKRSALRANERAIHKQFPRTAVSYHEADFTVPLELPPLNGVVIANALHFQGNHVDVVRLLRGYLGPNGRFLLVEYNLDRGNFAVPHPVPLPRWERVAREAGFAHTKLLHRRPSRFLREIYSAVSW